MFSLNHYKKAFHSLPLPTLPKLLKTTETQPNKIHYSHPKPTKTSPNFPKRSKPAHQRPNIGPTRPLKWFKHIPKRNLFGWWYFFLPRNLCGRPYGSPKAPTWAQHKLQTPTQNTSKPPNFYFFLFFSFFLMFCFFLLFLFLIFLIFSVFFF